MNEQELFLAALEIKDRAQRTAYVNEACGEDSALRQQVETLLAAHERSGTFLQVPAPVQLAGVEMNSEQIAEHELDLSFLEPPASSDSLGCLGHYEVQEVIGRGGFGIVLKAFDKKLHRVVAVKVMARELAATSPARKRFLREARAAAAVKHENIVQVHSVEEHPLPYLVMEFVEGETLQRTLDGAGPLGISELLPLARQMASGLAAAHAKGLIHRDIKPVNILIENSLEQKVKIADFGLARAADDASLTRSGLISGTPMYMSPEQARGEALDHRSDLFSLGSVLYQMASGRPPFRAQNAFAVLKRVNEDTPRPLQEIIPETPDWLCAIISKLHAKSREERIQSAQEVADLLNRVRSELVHEVVPPPVVVKRRNPPKRLGLGVVAGCCAVAIAIGAASMLRPPARELIPSNARSEAAKSQGGEHASRRVDGMQTPATPPQEVISADNKYLPLFNGRDLEGWEREGNPNATWTVDDGVLIGRWPPNSDYTGGSTIYTQRNDYRNFRFRIETQLCENWASSMVFSWRDDRPKKGWYRVQLGTTSGRDIFETGIVRRSLMGPPGPIAAPDPPVRPARREWFTLEVVVEGARLRVLVNGVRQTEFIAKLPPTPGHLGIALSGQSTIRIRKIEVQELGNPATIKDSDSRQSFASPDGSPPPAVAPFDADQARQHQDAWAKHLGVPVEYINSLGAKFRLIPPGEFDMGSTPEEVAANLPGAGDVDHWRNCIKSEAPQHRVVLTTAVYVGCCEVTQAEYANIIGENPSWFSAQGEGREQVKGLDTSRHPVEQVSWHQAADFCARLSDRENLSPVYSRNGDAIEMAQQNGYRLLTEAEWEFACRAGTTTPYWTGTDDESLRDAGWSGQGEGSTHSVGQLQANPFGLQDVHGNVDEWVQDAWAQDYYHSFKNTIAIDPLGAGKDENGRVTRGGDFYWATQECRSSARYSVAPAEIPTFSVGIRLALPVEAVKTLIANK